jgi:hypothetical protein
MKMNIQKGDPETIYLDMFEEKKTRTAKMSFNLVGSTIKSRRIGRPSNDN